MSEPSILALPSKGRLKEQAEAWLADCGLHAGGRRAARAAIAAESGRPAGRAGAAAVGRRHRRRRSTRAKSHLGVTGEDLLRERGRAMDSRVLLLRALGFGRADLVVAAPQELDRRRDHGRRGGRGAPLPRPHRAGACGWPPSTWPRPAPSSPATGWPTTASSKSGGATEGAPAAGAAELIVDITTTGATLAANGLKILADGLILKSQAQLAASLKAAWNPEQLAAADACCAPSRPAPRR